MARTSEILRAVGEGIAPPSYVATDGGCPTASPDRWLRERPDKRIDA